MEFFVRLTSPFPREGEMRNPWGEMERLQIERSKRAFRLNTLVLACIQSNDDMEDHSIHVFLGKLRVDRTGRDELRNHL
jgi:hypothetical protein